MNIWECTDRDCSRKCVGTGGAVGLRAIGWYFTYGGPILCPQHRPDAVPCIEQDEHPPCQLCAAEKEAEQWQRGIAAAYGFPPHEPRYQN